MEFGVVRPDLGVKEFFYSPSSTRSTFNRVSYKCLIAWLCFALKENDALLLRIHSSVVGNDVTRVCIFARVFPLLAHLFCTKPRLGKHTLKVINLTILSWCLCSVAFERR